MRYNISHYTCTLNLNEGLTCILPQANEIFFSIQIIDISLAIQVLCCLIIAAEL